MNVITIIGWSFFGFIAGAMLAAIIETIIFAILDTRKTSKKIKLEQRFDGRIEK